jgi:hypothetical protein
VQDDYDQGLPQWGEPTETGRGSLPALPGLVVGLRYSWRAMNAPWILELADRVRPGSRHGMDSVLECFVRHASDTEPVLTWHRQNPDRARRQLCQERWLEWAALSRSWTRWATPGHEADGGSATADQVDALGQLGRFQLLCSTNHQVDRANRAGTLLLWAQGNRPSGELPHGCPVLILTNDRSLGLSNGDIGIALGPISGGPATVVLFPGSDGVPRLFPRVRLPAHQPAFGLTIHKSQGSEWDRVALELPTRSDSELLTRNLLYTGITRSRRVLDLFGPMESLDLPSSEQP